MKPGYFNPARSLMLFTVPKGRSFLGCGTGIEFGLLGCLKM